MGGGMEYNKNKWIEEWGAARENLELNFRWSRRNLALVGIFGIAIPVLVYKGIVKEFVSSSKPLARESKGFAFWVELVVPGLPSAVRFTILTFSYWVGLEKGGVIAGLASCGLMMSILDTASGLMGDFKTGYLTLSMFFSQLIGTAMGCVITPLVFWIFNSVCQLGDPEGSYPAPYALMYCGIALLGVEGFGGLPKHCLNLSICFFLAAILINC
ncbi:hypothetical protein H5410_028410 [Solanum commersonii]|uniref:Uncharacterized protein n=1 Tax=Solanum commersonii TaxID=4109 RepID=A0A9J5Z7F0_SOLCO|nr:hypothetical protein H5410_028410 [Solanum commersonii]